jgi:hypothetical protein
MGIRPRPESVREPGRADALPNAHITFAHRVAGTTGLSALALAKEETPLPMRPPVQLQKLEALMTAMGLRVKGPGRIYLTGGATALLHGWRPMTVDVDLKGDPEPAGFFEAIAALKDELSVNIELASPSDFIPELPDWRERSIFIARHGRIDFYHYDPYSQALSKLERGHSRDLADVDAMLRDSLIEKKLLLALFNQIYPLLIRYPALDPQSFRDVVEIFCEPEK